MLKIPKRPTYPKHIAILFITIGLSVGTAFAMSKTGNEVWFPRSMWQADSTEPETAIKNETKVKSDSKEQDDQKNRSGNSAGTVTAPVPASTGQATVNSNPQGSTFVPGRGGGTGGTTVSPLPATTLPSSPATGGTGGGSGGGDGGSDCLCEVLTQPVEDTTQNIVDPPLNTLVAPTGLSLWLLGRGIGRKMAFDKIKS